MVTMHSWMFLDSFKNLRKSIIYNYSIYSILHLGYEAFDNIIGKVVQTVAFILKKSKINIRAQSIRLIDFYDSERYLKESEFFNRNNRYNHLEQQDFLNIPSYTFSYWVSKKIISCFKMGYKLEDKVYTVTKGIYTGNNNRFIRFWYEVNNTKVPQKWNKYSKGGPYRKWYGNSMFVINWEDNASELREYEGSGMGPSKYYGLPHIVWSKVTNLDITFRMDSPNVFFDDASPAVVFEEFSWSIFAFLNSKISIEIIKAIAPTLNYQIGDIRRMPLIEPDTQRKSAIQSLAINCTRVSKIDWDSFETSWDFKKHPILTHKGDANTIEEAFNNWAEFAEKQFYRLKANEEELNRIFIKIYGLEDELTPEVDEKDVTVSKADRERDVKSFISYAVGCMLGRYSPHVEGLVYAGGEWNDKWKVSDNIIPITDEEYFEDDIVARFVEFIKVTFGDERLEENLDFIAESVGKRKTETSRQALRRYFLKDFYKDHVQTYKKRPIYWLFDSGRQDGFKALIYMHRYDELTVARVRTDYLHKLQRKYEDEIKRLDVIIDSDLSQREKNNARRAKEKLQKQIQECLQYDQVIAHVANQKIKMDLDDGVKVNYAKFQGIKVPQGDGKKPLKANLLAKI